MKNQKIIRFVESFMLLPMITMSMPLGSLPTSNLNIVSTPYSVLSQKENIEAGGLLAFNQALDQKAKTLEAQAGAIDAYFRKYGMPLSGTGMKMATAAEANGLDWRLLPAIAVRESTGGKHACKKVTNSFFGWGSCKINFKSVDEAITVVAQNLGGNDEDTVHHYEGKTTEQILNKYNPESIVPGYAKQVMKIMNDIGDENLGTITINM
jgi:hypothetical protein